MPASASQRVWSLVAEGAVAAALVVLPLSIGGAPPWTLPLLCVVALVAAGAMGVGVVVNQRRQLWHPMVWLPVAVAALEVLQLIPLPPALLGLVSPRAAELRDFTLVPLGLERWRPVSVDAPSTYRALARTVALGALLWAAVQLGRKEAPRLRLYRVMAGVGIAVAVIGFGHAVAGAPSLFGVYTFFADLPLITPFGNTNHLAAFLTVTSTVALGLALSTPDREAALGWGAGALACGLATLLSMSRGGIAFFGVTWGLVAAVTMARRAGGVRAVAPWLAMGAVLLAAGGVAYEDLLLRAESLSSLEKLRATKVELWPMFFEGVRGFARTGLGVGAFEVGFTPFQTEQLGVTFTHPENVALQWLTEVGVVAALALSLAAAWNARSLWRGAREQPLETVVLLAVAGAALHDVFDFALELNAVPVLVAVALGLVAGSDEEASARRLAPGRLAAVLGAAVALSALGLVAGRPTHLEAERAVLEASRAAAAPADVIPQVKQAIDRHPSDWVLYANAAQWSALRGDARNALAWVNRWLQLRPNDPRAHLAAADALLRLGQRSQALLELKTAFSLGDFSALPRALAVASAQGDFERILVPLPGFLERAWGVLRSTNPGLAAQFLRVAEAEAPTPEVAREARLLLVRQLADTGGAAEALARFEELPADERGQQVVLHARVLAMNGRRSDGLGLLTARLRSAPADIAAGLLAVDFLSAEGRSAEARELIGRLRPFANAAASRVHLFVLEAALWSNDGRHGKALDALQTAARLEPQRADLHYRMASAHERLGAWRSALDEVRHGQQLDSPQGAAAQAAWVERLEASRAAVPLP
ncbi:MAG: O-antigen ligase family protein [Archangium sp.]|nr:O-antigen ligase family protein [Archangium sp.]